MGYEVSQNKNVIDFAQDQQTDPTHPVVMWFLHTVENSEYIATGVKDQMLVFSAALHA